MRQLFGELKRRNVYKVAVTYVVVAFVGLQAVDLLIPATTLPPWVDEFLVALAVFGFPIALVLAWAFEMTPEGVRRTADTERSADPRSMSPEERRSQSRLAMKALVGLGLVGAAVAGGWYLVGGGGETELRAGDRSIAVLPFENMGGDESEQFTKGVHDGLLTRLSNVSGLKVISRTSVLQFEETELPLPAIADSLGVKWVMEGGVQEMGDEIQVNAQLIDPRTDTHAWADSYRRNLTVASLFDLQSEITKQIARSLEAELTSGETERVERRPTESLDAYRLYVRGRNLLARRTPASIDSASDYFQRALEQDSAYALAWAGLADARVLDAAWGGGSAEAVVEAMRAAIPEARVAARRARELDPSLAEAWAALGAIHVYEQRFGLDRGNGPAALRELKRAVELKPSYAHAQQWLGELYLRLGRPGLALEHASLAVELNPRHAAARQVLIWVLVAQGEVEEARRHLERDSGNLPPHTIGLVLYHTGEWDELEALAQKQLEEVGWPWWHFYLARVAVHRGDTAAAREHLAEFREAEWYALEGVVHAALGDPDAAFSAWGKEGEELGPLPSPLMRYWYPDILDPLRDDPRYRELIRQLNRQWGLNPDGSLPDSVDVSFRSQPKG